jgi:hypothetical protein
MFPNATMVTVPTMVMFAVVLLIIRVPPPDILPAVYTHDGKRIPMLVPAPSIRIADCAGILKNGRTTKLADEMMTEVLMAANATNSSFALSMTVLPRIDDSQWASKPSNY